MSETRWEAAGLEVVEAVAYHAAAGVRLRSRGTVLGPEHARSLAWWLLAYVGDRSGPSAPDTVRVVIDEQRTALARRSAQDVSEDFRAGLAWAARALDEIADAASTDPRK
jgi:hypothetical protein